jgi:hypothetical protein
MEKQDAAAGSTGHLHWVAQLHPSLIRRWSRKPTKRASFCSKIEAAARWADNDNDTPKVAISKESSSSLQLFLQVGSPFRVVEVEATNHF